MNIVLVNHYAGSPSWGMEFRPYYMATEWVKSGHKVTVIASSFSHLRYKQPICKDKIVSTDIDGIRYIFLKTKAYHKNGFGRVINIIQFLKKLYFNYKSIIIEEPDVIIASSTYPFDVWICKKIAKKYSCKLIFEVHDLWPLSLKEIRSRTSGKCL